MSQNGSEFKRKIHAEICQLDPGLSSADKEFEAAAVLLASLEIGPSANRIAQELGYPRAKVREYGKRLRDNGVWVKDKVCFEEIEGDDEEDKDAKLVLQFWLYVCVAVGLIIRVD